MKNIINQLKTLHKHQKLKFYFLIIGFAVTIIGFLPVALFYSIQLDFNLNGWIIRLVFLSAAIFLLSYYHFLLRISNLAFIIISIILIDVLMALPFYILYDHMFQWYTYPPTRIWNHAILLLFSNGVYAEPLIYIIMCFIGLAITIVIIKKSNLVIGISFLLIFVFLSSSLSLFLFYLKDTILLGDAEVSPEIQFLAKPEFIAKETEQNIAIPISFKDARDLIVLPEKKIFFCCFGSTVESLYEKHIVLVKVSYGSFPIQFQAIEDLGSVKRAVLSKDRTKIYYANWFHGFFNCLDVDSMEIVSHYNLLHSFYYLHWIEKNGQEVPRFTRHTEYEEKPEDYDGKMYVMDIVDFHLFEETDEVVFLMDTVPTLIKFKMFPFMEQLKYEGECNLLHSVADFGTGGARLFYDEIRHSFFVIPYNSNYELYEVDAENLSLVRAVSPYEYGVTNFFNYNPQDRTFILSSMMKDIMYVISIDSLEVIDQFEMPRGLRKGYVNLRDNEWYFLDYFMGKFYVVDPIQHSIIKEYEVGHKPIAMEVHLELDKAFIVSSYGVMELPLSH